MAQITIVSRDRLSNTTYHNRCSSRGQRYWWLRQDGGDFVRLPEMVRGDYTFEATLDLAPGTYILGTGPSGKFGIRETIVVEG